MVTCELCGRGLKTTQGLRGHKTFIHGITGATGSRQVTRIATEHDIDTLESRLEKLERVSGTNESEVANLSDVNDDLYDTLRSNVAAIENRLGKFQKICDSLEHNLSTIKTTLFIVENYDLKAIPKIAENVSTLEKGLESVKSQLEYLYRVAKREPSGNMVRVLLTDGKEHTFKEYKSPKGLVKPQEYGGDFIFGKRWIDLHEPED